MEKFRMASDSCWIQFPYDRKSLESVRSKIEAGSGFKIEKIYGHPTKMSFFVMEIKSNGGAGSLDLECDSVTSPLVRLFRKPANCRGGMTVEVFEKEVIGTSLGRPRQDSNTAFFGKRKTKTPGMG